MDYHDVLAIVGAGSAHPGGFASTETWMKRISLTEQHHVLDVGCGTGRTLLELQRRFHCAVTGIDVRPAMIQKAKKRSRKRQTSASWLVASAESLPLQADTFDLVYTESVNVFVDVHKALREYHRVLKPGGLYVDTEMMVMGPVSEEFRRSAQQVYGARQVPDLRSWKALYRTAGFSDLQVIATYPVRPEDGFAVDEAYPDEINLSDPKAMHDPRVIQVLRNNSTWLEHNYRSLGYGIFLCQKGK